MSSRTITVAIKNYIQPFEEKLAIAELTSLGGNVPEPVVRDGTNGKHFRIETRVDADRLARRLAYAEQVEFGEVLLTEQIRLEASASAAATSTALTSKQRSHQIALPKRRCLRFGPHGMHEYRGKFFPQLARSLINVAGLEEGAVVMDPMCGSGTTCVETISLGLNSIGLDRNPLSVLISRAKCDVLSLTSGTLIDVLNMLSRTLRRRRSAQGSQHLNTLPASDLAYLRRWFRDDVLTDLAHIQEVLVRSLVAKHRRYFEVVLSNVLRRLSWQKEDDLRVRREPDKALPSPAIEVFLAEAERSTQLVESFLRHRRVDQVGTSSLKLGDARNLEFLGDSTVDAVITSPPYATALPYIDTDRLSLSFFNLESRERHRSLELEMIGNREVTEGVRRKYWDDYVSRSKTLPVRITHLIFQVHELNADADVGFRRKNLAALLGKYFLDMQSVIREAKRVLRPGSRLFMVVGDNHTVAGGVRVDINTAEFLGLLAAQEGASLVDSNEMEMLTSRDIFRKNASSSETIIEARF